MNLDTLKYFQKNGYFTIGSFKIKPFILSRFKLDGGSMFGPVPKPLWEKLITPDSRNRIPMVTRSLLLEGLGKKIIIDTGCGTKWTSKENDIFAFSEPTSLELGDNVVGVTDIIMTHLHFDHAGGLAYFNSQDQQQLVQSFPDAKVHVQKSNLQNCENPKKREKASYLPINVKSLKLYDLHLIDLETVELFPNVFVKRVDGHTVGQQYVIIKDDKYHLTFAADVMPFFHHRHEHYHMGFDMCAEKEMEEKMILINEAADHHGVVIFQHDFVNEMSGVTRDKDGNILWQQ